MRIGTFVLLMALLSCVRAATYIPRDIVGQHWFGLVLDVTAVPLWIYVGVTFRRRIAADERDAEIYRAERAERARWLGSAA